MTSLYSVTGDTYNLKGEPLKNEDVDVAHKRWYQKQPTIHCRRCDREFPNSSNDQVEYCSRDCELGWFPPAAKKQEPIRPKAKHKGRHLPVSRYSSDWS